MGRIFQKPPQKGDPISRAGIAEGLAKIDHVLTKMYVASGGSIDWALGYPRFRLSGGGGGGVTNQTWALKIDGDTAICSECHLMVSTIAVFSEHDLTIILSGKLDGWLCAQYNTLSKQLNLYFGDAQVAYDPSSQLVLVPLYRLAKDDDDNWQVELDARNMPRLGVYL